MDDSPRTHYDPRLQSLRMKGPPLGMEDVYKEVSDRLQKVKKAEKRPWTPPSKLFAQKRKDPMQFE